MTHHNSFIEWLVLIHPYSAQNCPRCIGFNAINIETSNEVQSVSAEFQFTGLLRKDRNVKWRTDLSINFRKQSWTIMMVKCYCYGGDAMSVQFQSFSSLLLQSLRPSVYKVLTTLQVITKMNNTGYCWYSKFVVQPTRSMLIIAFFITIFLTVAQGLAVWRTGVWNLRTDSSTNMMIQFHGFSSLLL